MAATKGVPRCVAALCAGAGAAKGAALNLRRAERLCWAQNLTKKSLFSSSSFTSGGEASSNVAQLKKTPKSWRGAALHCAGSAFATGHSVRRGFRSSSSIRAAAVAEKEASGAEKSDSGGYDYDLVTIGAGSGGVRASRIASQLGAKVAIVELPYAAISSNTAGGVGGTCVLRGCVPKKILVFGATYEQYFRESRNFGWSFDSPPTHDWPTLIKNKNKELQRLLGVYKNILSSNNVELIEGRGKIVDANTVEIDGKVVKTKHILVSVGGRSTVPDLPGKEHVITSDDALDLPARPNKICIVGGGYIALEFAGIFKGLGSEVHVFVRQDKVLRGFDEEIREFLGEQMAMKGINFHFGESPTAIEKLGEGKFKLVTTKGEEIADTIMFATGRKANTQGIGLEAVGVELDPKGAVVVDEYSRTSKENIWAVGDVTNRMNLTPVAIMEGTAFAKTAFGEQPTKPSHKAVPSAVFTSPPIGTVGLTEAQAVEAYGDVDVYTSGFRPMKAIISELGDRSFMKMIVDPSTDKVLGVHMCGEEAPEIMQGFGIVVKVGLTKAQVDSTVGIHPTAAEELVTLRTPTRQVREKKKHSHHHDH